MERMHPACDDRAGVCVAPEKSYSYSYSYAYANSLAWVAACGLKAYSYTGGGLGVVPAWNIVLVRIRQFSGLGSGLPAL